MFALFKIGFTNPPCKLTHPPKICLSFGHTDNAARIQDVEGV